VEAASPPLEGVDFIKNVDFSQLSRLVKQSHREIDDGCVQKSARHCRFETTEGSGGEFRIEVFAGGAILVRALSLGRNAAFGKGRSAGMRTVGLMRNHRPPAILREVTLPDPPFPPEERSDGGVAPEA